MLKKVLAFRIEGCPYCAQAMRAVKELAADEKYSSVVIDWVEENEHPEISAKYNYYYVPTFFVDGVKLYEAKRGESYDECKANVKRVLDEALA